MALFAPFLTELLTGLSSVWPELVLPGSGTNSNFWTSVQAFRKNLESEAALSQQSFGGAVAPPYIVISIGDFRDEPNYSLGAVRFKRAPIQIFYIMSTNAASNTTAVEGTQDRITESLVAARNFFDYHDLPTALGGPAGGASNFTTFQVQEYGRINTSETNPWNMAAVGVNKGELLAGHVLWDPGWVVDGH